MTEISDLRQSMQHTGIEAVGRDLRFRLLRMHVSLETNSIFLKQNTLIRYQAVFSLEEDAQMTDRAK
eukprot:10293664-Heterocapsa_arctica.AAC.1